jgi:acid stress-induced BolA-like protein IbaG/YrbA
MISPEEIKTTLEQALPGSTIEVRDLTGGGDHWQLFIVSPAFEGKGLVEQHQIVYAALKDAMEDQRIHALALKTFTPAEWEKLGS